MYETYEREAMLVVSDRCKFSSNSYICVDAFDNDNLWDPIVCSGYLALLVTFSNYHGKQTIEVFCRLKFNLGWLILHNS